eukprot:1573416-Rhodomonas_salina.1
MFHYREANRYPSSVTVCLSVRGFPFIAQTGRAAMFADSFYLVLSSYGRAGKLAKLNPSNNNGRVRRPRL